MVKLRVPASSANLGPGFDSFGCALTLYNEYTFELADQLEITGCPSAFCNEENLTVVAFKKTLEAIGEPYTGLKMHMHCEIPVTRGLGSSAAMIVAGIRGANALYGNRLSRQQMLEIATEMEGHPDNVAPALLGGFVVSLIDQGKPISVCLPVHPDLRFIALIPDFPLSTEKARKILPHSVSREDAIFNLSHAGMLPTALKTGDETLIRATMQDRIYESYRRSLMTDIDIVEKAAREQGALAFCFSGAGPTCLCLTKDPDFASRLQENLHTPNSNWKIMELSLAPEEK